MDLQLPKPWLTGRGDVASPDPLNSRRPDLAGKLALRWIIAANGRVASAEALPAATIDDPATVARILDAVRTWRSAEPLGGGVVEVSYPFFFRAAAAQP